MLAAGAFLLALTAVAPTVGGVAASTYDEAACDKELPIAPEPRDEPNCSEPPPPPTAPAVIDCNDARASHWVAEMIGSCDMPRPSAPAAALRARDGNGDGPGRLCDGVRCHHDSSPLRPVARQVDDGGVAFLGRAAVPHVPCAGAALAAASIVRRSQAGRDRLDRPPRAS